MIAVTTPCLPIEALPPLPACATAEPQSSSRDSTSAVALSREIWRRALLTGDQRAWQVVYQEHNRQVGTWVKAQLRFPVDAVTRQTLIDDAFVKMAGTFTRHPEKFADYPNLAALLGLLRCCAQRVVQDYVKAQQQALPMVVWDLIDEPVCAPAPTDADLRQVLAGLVADEKEWLVVTRLLLEAVKPRHLYAEEPALFQDVNEINTIRERVKSRLQRNQAFHYTLALMVQE